MGKIKHLCSRLAIGGTALFTLWLTGCTAYILDTDVVQERFDAATPPLDGSYTVIQSFVCRRPKLCAIELLPAVYQALGEGALTLLLRNPAQGYRELAEQSIGIAHIRHNVPLLFSFVPQSDSAGKVYELLIKGTTRAQVGFWYSSVDAYTGGELLSNNIKMGDLRFTTCYHYDLPALVSEVGEVLLCNAWLILPLTALLFLPGYVLGHSLNLTKANDPIANMALTMAISLALVPVALLWSTVVGLHWGRIFCLRATAMLALLALAHLYRTRLSDFAAWSIASNRKSALAVLALFSFTLLVRFIQIRDLVLPAWVDSPQHVLVADLISLHGQVPRSYEPLLPIQNFIYHFGFHANTVLFHWLSGLAIPQAVLFLGQVLNACSALMAYLLALRLTRCKLAAVIATLVVGLVSYMPAYYVSWGRYTQLTGLLLLPAALVTALDWLEANRRDYRLLLLAGLVQAGLFLTHARVTIFGACFLAVYLFGESGGFYWHKDKRAALELWERAGLLFLLVLLLSGPWLAQVIDGIYTSLRLTGRTLRGDPSYNAFPTQLLFIARNRELIVLAVIGAVWGLLRRRKETVWVLGWCGMVALVVNPGCLGLPSTNLVNNVAAVIALFLPISVLDGQAIALLWDRLSLVLFVLLKRFASPLDAAKIVRIALWIFIGGAALWGGWGMISIVNPATVLATAEDLAAMHWIEENTPPDAVFLINARHWQLGAYTGTDGGYWISQLTGRRTLLPALSYTYGTPNYVRHVANIARIISEIRDANDPQLQAILEQEKVTHVYIGAKGGPLTPQMFLGDPCYRLVYHNGAVWIFEYKR